MSVLMPGPDAVLSVSSIALKTAMPARHRQGPGSPERTVPILLPNFPQNPQMGMHTSCMLQDEPQTGPNVRSWMNILAGQHVLPTSQPKHHKAGVGSSNLCGGKHRQQQHGDGQSTVVLHADIQ